MLLASILGTVDPTIDLIDTLGRATGPVILAFVIIGLLRGWIVTGRECAEVRAELERALDLVYKQAEITNRALDVTEKKL